MARAKKVEIPVQEIITNDLDWQKYLTKEGLAVVDVYQQWCGPCKPILQYFRKWKNEIGSPHLLFAVAECDNITVLKQFRGKCNPIFLFFASGYLIGILREVNPPALLKTITKALPKEVEALQRDAQGDGRKSKRPAITIPEFQPPRRESLTSWGSKTKEPEIPPENLLLVCLIKPDLVRSDLQHEVMEKIRGAGLVILEQDVRQITEAEADVLYEEKKEEKFYSKLVKYMTSGNSIILLLSTTNEELFVHDHFRDILGPKSVADAKRFQPTSLRALFGVDDMKNGVHASFTPEETKRDMELFFPDLNLAQSASLLSADFHESMEADVTLGMIRPEAMRLRKEIMNKIRFAGYEMAMLNEVSLTEAQAREFYMISLSEEDEELEEVVAQLSSGPFVTMAIRKKHAVAAWKKYLGPKDAQEAREHAPRSFRGKLAIEENYFNPLHASENADMARRELEFFFPINTTFAAIKPDAMAYKDLIVEKIKEAGFDIVRDKEEQISSEQAEVIYAHLKNSAFYEDVVNHVCSGPMYMMALKKDEALTAWRELMGPTSPEEARLTNVDSIRAEYGTDLINNAVHGAASPAEAFNQLKIIFELVSF